MNELGVHALPADSCTSVWERKGSEDPRFLGGNNRVSSKTLLRPGMGNWVISTNERGFPVGGPPKTPLTA
jgi:hypothetical protein